MGSLSNLSLWTQQQKQPSHVLIVASGLQELKVPVPGYGTISESPDDLIDTISKALQAGVRHLDCAWEYGVDPQIGEGIKNSGIPRSELFITHKVNPHFYKPEHIRVCLDQMLNGLSTSYIDLLLLHLPVALQPLDKIEEAQVFPGSTFEQRRIATTSENLWVINAENSPKNVAELNGQIGSILPTWNAMKDLVKSGLVKAIGVSNFSIIQLKEILDDPAYMDDGIPLSANEIEMNPYCPSTKLLSFMKNNSIAALGHSPFAANKWLYKVEEADWIFDELVPKKHGVALLKHPKLLSIAEQYRADVGQVIQSWIVQKGVVPLGRSTNLERVKKNLDLRVLSQKCVEEIDKLECPGQDGRGLIMKNVFPGINFPIDDSGP